MNEVACVIEKHDHHHETTQEIDGVDAFFNFFGCHLIGKERFGEFTRLVAESTSCNSREGMRRSTPGEDSRLFNKADRIAERIEGVERALAPRSLDDLPSRSAVDV